MIVLVVFDRSQLVLAFRPAMTLFPVFRTVRVVVGVCDMEVGV
jgi:hypothetical protein